MDEARRKELAVRYEAAAHAVQSGVAALIGMSDSTIVDPKHLRVGVVSAMVETGTLAKLLIKAGVFTEEDYLVELCEMWEAEKARFEADLSRRTGKDIKLV